MSQDKKIWVPMPATKLYGGDSETIRDRFVAQYGEATVHNAEHQCVLDFMMLMGVVKPSEFLEVLEKKLRRTDERRRHAAGLPT